ncbi:MAG: class I SAM-dependent methyltransferase [Deferribacterales bacterium]
MSVFDARASEWEKKGRRVQLAKDVVSAIIKYAEPKKDIDIADFGTGTGLIMLGLSEYGRSLTGFDTSQGMLDVLNEKVENAGLKNIKTVLLDVKKEDFPKESFDMFTASMVIHHMDEPEIFFRKAYDAIRTGGQICVADLELTEEPFHDVPHEGVKHGGFEPEALAEMLRSCGYKDVQINTAAVIEKERDGRKIEFPIILATGHK